MRAYLLLVSVLISAAATTCVCYLGVSLWVLSQCMRENVNVAVHCMAAVAAVVLFDMAEKQIVLLQVIFAAFTMYAIAL